MCGRYEGPFDEEIVEAFDVERVEFHQPPSGNVSPTQAVRIVVETHEEPVRQMVAARWDLVPSWAKQVNTRPLINARAETVVEKPSFRSAILRRRAIVPARGTTSG